MRPGDVLAQMDEDRVVPAGTDVVESRVEGLRRAREDVRARAADDAVARIAAEQRPERRGLRILRDDDEEGAGARVPGDARGEAEDEQWRRAPVAQEHDPAGTVARSQPVRPRQAIRHDRAEIPVDDGILGGDPLERRRVDDEHFEIARRASRPGRGLAGEEGHLSERPARVHRADAELRRRRLPATKTSATPAWTT